MIKENIQIVGLCGRAYSGKTSLSRFLAETRGYKRIYMAQALKELCSQIYHCSIDQLNLMKNEQKDFVLHDADLRFISQETNIPLSKIIEEFAKINNTLTSTRHAFQFIGTDVIRKHNPNWHIEKMFSKMEANQKYVVDDVRFPNEVQALKYYDAFIIFVVRPTLRCVSHHLSEESLDWKTFDNFIINNQDSEHAKKQLLGSLDHDSNPYADEAFSNYVMNWNEEGNVELIQAENPVKIALTNNGEIIQEFDGMTHPFEIEDYKFMADESK